MEKNYNIADEEWEWYISKLYNRLIERFCASSINCVVELAPGFRHKIALALKETNFNGTIYVIDNSRDVLDYVEDKYKEILPDANIICINKDFKDSIELLPSNIDLFLSNHSIDDLIISKYSNISYNKEVNNEILLKNLLSSWEKLYTDKKKNNIIDEVVNEFKKLFESKNIKLVIMGQYKSNSYYLNQQTYMDYITNDCFNKIKQLVIMDNDLVDDALSFYPFGYNDKRYNYKELTDNTQSSKNWIVGIPKEK